MLRPCFSSAARAADTADGQGIGGAVSHATAPGVSSVVEGPEVPGARPAPSLDGDRGHRRPTVGEQREVVGAETDRPRRRRRCGCSPTLTSIGPNSSSAPSVPATSVSSATSISVCSPAGSSTAAPVSTERTLPPTARICLARVVGDVGVGQPAGRQLARREGADQPHARAPGWAPPPCPGAICPNTSASSAGSSRTTSTPRGLVSAGTGVDAQVRGVPPVRTSTWASRASTFPAPRGPVVAGVAGAASVAVVGRLPRRRRRRPRSPRATATLRRPPVLLGGRDARVTGREDRRPRRRHRSAAPASATRSAGGVRDVDRQVDLDRADRRQQRRQAGRRRRPRRRRGSDRAAISASGPSASAPHSDIVSSIGRRSAPVPALASALIGTVTMLPPSPAGCTHQHGHRGQTRRSPSTAAISAVGVVGNTSSARAGRCLGPLGGVVERHGTDVPSADCEDHRRWPRVTAAMRWSGGGVRESAVTPSLPYSAPLGDDLQHGVGDEVVERSAVDEASPQVGARHLEAGHLDTDPRDVVGQHDRLARTVDDDHRRSVDDLLVALPGGQHPPRRRHRRS